MALAALTAVAAVLRFGTLDRQSLWVDELVTVSLLRQSFGDMLHAIPQSEATPYLYYVLAWPWSRVFGTGEIGLRSLSALAGTLAVIAAYAAGSALVSRRVGLVTGGLVAVNPFLVWYSQEARAYALVTLFCALSLWFFARALNRDSRAVLWWALSAALALATHYFAVFAVVPEAVWLLVRLRDRRTARLSLLPAAVLLAHVPLILDQRGNGESVSQSSLTSRIAGIPKDLVVGYSFPAELAGSIVAAALVLAGLFLTITRTREHRRRRAFVAGALASLAVLVPVVLALAGADYVLARNAIVAVVPGVICIAAGYASSRAALALAAALASLSLAIALSASLDTRYGRTDWRGVAQHLRITTTPRALVVTPEIETSLWRLYLPGIRHPEGDMVRVGEIVVAGLATQGGFSTHAVSPPTTAPVSIPKGFGLVERRRTPTYTLFRYRAQGRLVRLTTAELGRLRLIPAQGAVFLQVP